MSNRRFDVIYFFSFLLVVLIGYLAANADSGEIEGLEIPDFSMPGIEIEVPFELPYAFVEFTRVSPPQLILSDGMESAVKEVREALLESSAPIELREDVRHVAVRE
jgi:hypothetical protein